MLLIINSIHFNVNCLLAEATAPKFKATKDRITVLLGGNANGDYKFKPVVVYDSESTKTF
jgi:hypothetical protein